MKSPQDKFKAANTLIEAELDRQSKMWDLGEGASPNALYADGQLMLAATAQLVAIDLKQAAEGSPFDETVAPYWPSDWSGMRDYGSDVANLVVAAAWIQREIDRLIKAGADTTRLPRDPLTQPYAPGSAPKTPEA